MSQSTLKGVHVQGHEINFLHPMNELKVNRYLSTDSILSPKRGKTRQEYLP